MSIQIYKANLQDPFDARGMLDILAGYHESSMGNGCPLPKQVRDSVIDGILARNNHLVFLAVCKDELNDSNNVERSERVVGMAVCFENFSTFRAKPLINVHDLAVHPDFQGQGIGQSLIETVVAYANSRHCCAVTLEVRKDNSNALKLYRRLKFSGIEEDAADETMLFGKLVL